jgi:hypothetical protein
LARPTTTSVPLNLSKAGAFNGSAFALGSTVVEDPDGMIEFYFQHWTGEIRYLVRNDAGDWSGGDSSHTVATDAKNATELSLMTYTFNETATWHLFYTDRDNILRQRTRTSLNSEWQDGPLGDLKLSPMNDSNVAFEVCYESYTSPDTFGLGMSLYYATDAQTVQGVNWMLGQTEWTPTESFTMNGHAGIGCYTWGLTTIQYLMYLDLDHNLKMMWKDLNTTKASTDTHPINQWVNTTLSIPGLAPVSPIGYNNNLVVQMQNLSIVGFNLTLDSENSDLNPNGQFRLHQTPMNGTHLWLWYLPTNSGDAQLTVFYQINGSDITSTMRDMVTGQISMEQLPIPDT